MTELKLCASPVLDAVSSPSTFAALATHPALAMGLKLAAAAVLSASLSACVVAPWGPHYRGAVVGQVVVEGPPVVVAPAPVVVVRPPVYYGPRYPYRHRY
jgi:hypothetical protein